MLHDRMIAFFVQRQVAVPISGSEFFTDLDECYSASVRVCTFCLSQVAEYDHKRTKVSALRQLTLFVQDEASATQWIRQQLQVRPQTFQDLQPQFMRQLQSWAKHEKTIELKEILRSQFPLLQWQADRFPARFTAISPLTSRICVSLTRRIPVLRAKANNRWYVPDPRKEGDLEELRFRTLLKEFEEIPYQRHPQDQAVSHRGCPSRLQALLRSAGLPDHRQCGSQVAGEGDSGG